MVWRVAMADEPKLKPVLKDDQQLLELEPLTDGDSTGEAGFAGRVTRRTFISGLGAAGLVVSASPLTLAAEQANAPAPVAQDASTTLAAVSINGKKYELSG